MNDMPEAKSSVLPENISLQKIYSSMVACLQREMGEESFAKIMLDVRQSGVSEILPIDKDEPLIQMLVRLGWLDGINETDKFEKTKNILQEMASALERTPAAISILFKIFAEGIYGDFSGGICANVPHCQRCDLSKNCKYYNRPSSIKNKDKCLSPEVKLERNGVDELSDIELVASIIGSGKVSDKVIEIAEDLINRYSSLRGISSVGFTELTKLAAINGGMARRLIVAYGLSERLSIEKSNHQDTINSAKDFFELYHLRLRDFKQEVFWVVLLDQKNKIIRDMQIAQGLLNKVLVHPREVFKPAIKYSAASIVVLHNHPSGDPTPSKEDRAITKRLKQTAEIVGISLLDHIIIGDSTYTSFVDEGIL